MAPINQCPPGGSEGTARLAVITGQSALPLNPQNGVEAPRAVAVIDEAWCIGCTLCLPVCPTDAIFGSNKAMHSVIEPHCTGCALCIPVCPVDCISLEVVTGQRTGWAAWSDMQAREARQRYDSHRSRSGQGSSGASARAPQRPVQDGAMESAAAHRDATQDHRSDAPASGESDSNALRETMPDEAGLRKRAVIEAALTRARALRRS